MGDYSNRPAVSLTAAVAAESFRLASERIIAEMGLPPEMPRPRLIMSAAMADKVHSDPELEALICRAFGVEP